MHIYIIYARFQAIISVQWPYLGKNLNLQCTWHFVTQCSLIVSVVKELEEAEEQNSV